MTERWNLVVLIVVFYLVLIGVYLPPPNTGYPGGSGGDAERDYGGCASGCHTLQAESAVSISVDDDLVPPNGDVEVTVKVTPNVLGVGNKVGVFLLRALADSEAQPSVDGWTVNEDPNGGTNNYVEKEAEVGEQAVFKWKLAAPSTAGTYKLYTRIHHGNGGGGSLFVNLASGIEVLVDPGEVGPLDIAHTPADSTRLDLPVEIQAIIGDTDGVTGAAVHYKLAGASQYTEAPMGLASGTANSGTWTATIPAPGSAGSLKYFVEATNGTATVKSAVYTVELIGEVVPDVRVEEVSVGGEELQEGHAAVVYGVIGTNSTEDLEGLKVLFYVDGDVIAEFENVTIPANSQRSLTATWTPEGTGEHRVKVAVVPAGSLEEYSTRNNERASTFEVQGAEPGLPPGLDLLALGVFGIIFLLGLGAAARAIKRRSGGEGQ